MITRRSILHLLSLTIFLSQTCLAADRKQYIDANAVQVDAMFASWNTSTTPGAAVLVIQNGKVLLKRTYGMADLESKIPITAKSSFQLASVSKQFTAMAVMMLAERGKLRYDDKLIQYFPSFSPLADQITVRHLLNHTSGLREYDYSLRTTASRAALGEAVRSNPTAMHAAQSLMREQNLRFAPGTAYEYNNSNYLLLALIVEKVSGERFASFVKSNIFDRLAMRDSLVLDERHLQPQRKVVSYHSAEKTYTNVKNRYGESIYGCSNVFVTLDDLARWDQALYTDRLVRRETLEQAFSSGRLDDGTDVGYGFGWQVRDFLGLPAQMHSGWWLGFRNFILRVPSQKFSVIVLANSDDLNANVFAADIAKIYLREQLTVPKEVVVSRAVKEQLLGTYETRERTFAMIELEGDDLRLSMSGQQWLLLPESNRKFFLKGREEETVELNLSPSGEVEWVILRGNPVQKTKSSTT